MIRIVLPALLALVAALPAAAQTGIAIGGNVGSAALRGGYPAGGGAITLPAIANPGGAVTTLQNGTMTNPGSTGGTATSTTLGSSGGASAGASSGGGRSAGTTTSGGTRSSSRSGGGHWVLCPPAGEGLEPFLSGTGLSCAPD